MKGTGLVLRMSVCVTDLDMHAGSKNLRGAAECGLDRKTRFIRACSLWESRQM